MITKNAGRLHCTFRPPGHPFASIPGVEENTLDRLNRLATGILPGTIRTATMGENYYSFAMAYPDGTTTELPHIWIDPADSDDEIRVRLKRAINEALHPDNEPDDASVPNIQAEEAGNWHDR